MQKTQEGQIMKVGSLIGKFVSAKTGSVLGGIVGFVAGMRGAEGIYSTVVNAMSGAVHSPFEDPADLWDIFSAVKTMMPIVIGGALAQHFGKGIHPIIGRVGKFVTAFGSAYMAAGIGANLIYHSTHSTKPAGAPYTGTNAHAYPRIPTDPYNPVMSYTARTVPPHGAPHLAAILPAYPKP